MPSRTRTTPTHRSGCPPTTEHPALGPRTTSAQEAIERVHVASETSGRLVADTRRVALGLENLENSLAAAVQSTVEAINTGDLVLLAAEDSRALAQQHERHVHELHGVVAVVDALADRIGALAQIVAQAHEPARVVADAAALADLTTHAREAIAGRVEQVRAEATGLATTVTDLAQLTADSRRDQVQAVEHLAARAGAVSALRPVASGAESLAWECALVLGGWLDAASAGPRPAVPRRAVDHQETPS